jgi:hypothetical protein
MMKKLLSIVAIGALLSSGVQADDGTVTETLKVLPSAVVGFTSTSALALGEDDFVNGVIDFADSEIGDTPIYTQEIFVRTNVADTHTVTMTVTDAINAGKLHNPDADTDAATLDDNDIVMAYKYGVAGSEVVFVLGDIVLLTTGSNDGTSSVGNLIATPTIVGNQLAGTYSTVLNVHIAAN